MTILEEIAEWLHVGYDYFASFQDIGAFFSNLWDGIVAWFSAFFTQIGNLFG